MKYIYIYISNSITIQEGCLKEYYDEDREPENVLQEHDTNQ
jgi:hypothetical protein